MRDGRTEAEAGFFLVEVLVGLAILGVALVSMMPLFVVATKQNTAAGDLTFATTAAQDKLEALDALPYAYLTAGSDSIKLRSMVFDRTWTIQNDTPHAGMKTVTVTVTPRRRNPFGANRVVTVRSYRVP